MGARGCAQLLAEHTGVPGQQQLLVSIGAGGEIALTVVTAGIHSCLLFGCQNSSTKSFLSSTSSSSSAARTSSLLSQKSETAGRSYQKDFEFCHFLNLLPASAALNFKNI